jgi:hypothetical protein
MNREWVTLAFGISLVIVVVIVSIRQNVSSDPESADAPASEAAEPGAPTPERTTPQTPSTRPSIGADTTPGRLNAAVGVVHKHRFGSCDGTLRATGGVLTYTTTNRDDAFRLPFSEIDEFELDDDRTNLRVHQSGGRTWNFTGPGESSGPLVAFYREVERSRRRP